MSAKTASVHSIGLREAPSIYKQADLSIKISAPGKVILHGEHSVVYGKLAIAGTLDLRTRAEYHEVIQGKSQHNPFVTIELSALNLTHNYPLQLIQDTFLTKPLPVPKPQQYSLERPDLIDHDVLLRTCTGFVDSNSGSTPLTPSQRHSLISLFYLYSAMLRSVDFPHPTQFVLNVETDLTLGAGIGSSASFLVTLSALFLQLIKLKIATRQPDSFTRLGYRSYKPNTSDYATFDPKELELISRWAYCAEKIIHGTPSGIDNSICTYGSLLEFRKSSGPKTVDVPHKFKIVLVDTRVMRETKKMVERVAALRERNRGIVDVVLELMNTVAVEALEILPLASREMLMAMGSGNVGGSVLVHFDKLADLININHNLLRTLRVSHQKLDEVVSIFEAAGLFAKLTGAGGGGFAFAIVPPTFHKVHLTALIDELEAKGFRAVVTHLGGPGVIIEGI